MSQSTNVGPTQICYKLCAIVVEIGTDIIWTNLKFFYSKYTEKNSKYWKVYSECSVRELFWSTIVRCPFVCKLLTFSSSLVNHCTNFNQTWHKTSLREVSLSFFKWEGPLPLPRGNTYYYNEIAQYVDEIEKSPSRTTGPISTKLDTKHIFWWREFKFLQVRTIQFLKWRLLK